MPEKRSLVTGKYDGRAMALSSRRARRVDCISYHSSGHRMPGYDYYRAGVISPYAYELRCSRRALGPSLLLTTARQPQPRHARRACTPL